MYFRDEKRDTNIDKEFENENLISNILRFINKYKLIIIIAIIIIIIISIILLFLNKKVTNYLTLNGEKKITLYQGTDYVEPGYTAYNSKNKDLTNNVIIKSTLDTSKIGEYEIVYSIKDKIKTRKIIVIEKPKEHTYIYLKTINNNVNIYLRVGEPYIEPGYQVFNSEGKDLTNEVKVTGTVDTTKKGTYKLIYSLIDSNNITISESRTIVVMDTEVNLSFTPNITTNNDVNIKIEIIDNYFDYMILPDNTKTREKIYSYKVNKNDKYIFKIYNKQGFLKEESIEIKNIDKEEPTGNCSGTYKNGKSTINILANDTSGISKYVINNKEYTSNEIIINSKLKNVNVTIYDKAGNAKNISCELKKEIHKKPSIQSVPQTNKPIINNITQDGVIITVSATSNDADIAGYYFNYWNDLPSNKTSKYIKTNKEKIEIVRLSGTTYVWVEDTKGNISEYKTVNISTENLLITTGKNYKILNGIKLSDYLEENDWSIEELNNLIARSVRAAGIGTRTGAATAAVSLQTVLAQKFGIKLPYESGGIYRKFGASTNWGKSGMDCSAFVTWSYYNSGYNDLYIQPAYWAGWKTYEFNKDNGEIGDFLVKGKNEGNRHVKLIIGKTDDAFIIAEASGKTDGMVVKKHPYSSSDGYKVQKGSNFDYYYDAIDIDLYPSGF